MKITISDQQWLKWCVLCAVLVISGCGLYLGSEGVKYLSEDLTGFRTPAVDRQIQANRKKAYEDGKAERVLSEPEELVDGSVTVVTGETVVKVGGSALSTLMPFGGTIGLILTIIFGGISRIRKDRKNGN